MGNQREPKHLLALLRLLRLSALARLRLAKPKFKVQRNVER
jgi:hypothetical protein